MTDTASLASMIARLALNDPELTKVRVEDTTFDVETWIDFCQALATNSVTTGISLHRVVLPWETGIEALAEALGARPTAVHLDLFRMRLGVQGALALARCLTGSDKVESLSLFEVGLGHGGAAAVARMVEGTRSIAHFCVMDSTIGEGGSAGTSLF